MSGQGCGYTEAQDLLLNECFLEITQDPIIGKNQLMNFRQHVEACYNERRSGSMMSYFFLFICCKLTSVLLVVR